MGFGSEWTGWPRELKSSAVSFGVYLILLVAAIPACIGVALIVFMITEWPPGSAMGGLAVATMCVASLALAALFGVGGRSGLAAPDTGPKSKLNQGSSVDRPRCLAPGVLGRALPRFGTSSEIEPGRSRAVG